MQPLARLWLIAGSSALAACHQTVCVLPCPAFEERGGIYVAHNLGCERGCEQIARGDVIHQVDDHRVSTAEEFDAMRLTDGRPHQLVILTDCGATLERVEVVAEPNNELPPLENAPPFWTVSAEKLAETPPWARRRMFGHASPRVMLAGIDGRVLDGRQLYGRKRFIVYWYYDDRVEFAAAVDFMQVLQKAQADLRANGVEVMFVHVPSPAAPHVGMSEADAKAFREEYGLESDGKRLPPVPMYRLPSAAEYSDAREVGMDDSIRLRDQLFGTPTIVLLDERGIVRWHSEGVQQPPPDGWISDPEQHTVIAAVLFALERL